MTRTIGVLAIALLLGATTTRASAQTSASDEQARIHFQAGTLYFEQERFEDAAREYEEAFALSPRPELLLNAATAWDRAARLEEAIAALERVMQQFPGTESAQLAQPRLDRLRRMQERLVREREEAAARAAATTTATTTEPTTSEGGGGLDYLPGTITLSASAVIAAVAIGLGVAAHDTYSTLEEQCTGGVCPGDLRDDRDSASTLADVSTALTFVAAAGGIAGVVLIVVAAIDDAPSPTTERVELAPGPGDVGLGARIRF
ncbi:tetratricopeptide repeat protein [Sandaracinus amylolyticus]|nr:tetratricopeptide repeat protein [Sandaracinus amylolyticus]